MAKDTDELLKQAYAEFSNNKSLKLVLDDIMDFCGLDRLSLDVSFLDSRNLNSMISYREGQRSVACYINDRVEESNVVKNM